jgi:hypothetical protein
VIFKNGNSYLLKKMFSFVKQVDRYTVKQKMKKALSISLSLLMLLAVSHISVATHYCSGHRAASKISLSGKLATCGMENDDIDLPQTGTALQTHCCENVLTVCGINNNYFPSFTLIPESYNNDFQILSIPISLTINSIPSFKIINTSVNPPGATNIKSVDLSAICVYRI